MINIKITIKRQDILASILMLRELFQEENSGLEVYVLPNGEVYAENHTSKRDAPWKGKSIISSSDFGGLSRYAQASEVLSKVNIEEEYTFDVKTYQAYIFKEKYDEFGDYY